MNMTEAADFDSIYQTFYVRIHRYLARLAGPDDADDLAQEVFLRVSRGLPEFRGESSISTWLYRISTNAARDRARGAEHRAAVQAVEVDGCDPIASHDPSAESQTIRNEMSGCVQDLLAQLPEDYRTVLILSETEELKNREIAEVLGISLEAAKIRLHRARASLRQRLEARCSFSRSPENILVCDIKAAKRA
jgi:RNA polymerase sigma-70 factor (ECF subfamily)